ncbi:thiamine biosynthesis protein ThiI [Haloarcula vallismortis]|uniref:Probable tRNA sulfurtransferase n=2 Tax=Haloarcula vallismortis TaxID=28442 RepID=M0JQM6_HALVA|nr:tRNA sulfurtransferase [Haloarcula vallismortis]EMA10289.1 thiamine biosynthesis protein [Haloarcula vallismortis ATCC 29715]SDW89009.1 thiamine biosynthesis protein ThiI [Haloarcula vallismortis]
MHPPDADSVLVRHGELGVKSDQVRRKMEQQMADNLRAMLTVRDLSGDIDQRRNRLFIHTDHPEGVTTAAADTFGVTSASAVTTVDPTLSAIADALATTTRMQYDGGTFAVEARRAGPPAAHPFSSLDIESTGGTAIGAVIAELGGEPAVDLDDPDFELFVECRADQAYVFCEKCAGPGGLPLGTQQPVVGLVSGGIDSPVAAWKLMKRGAPVVPVYVDLGDYGGPDHRARAVSTVETLAAYAPGHDLSLNVVDAGDVVTDLTQNLGSLRMLVLRRFMLAVAEAIAHDFDAVGIVTGEAIGQKSSQTSANIAVTDAATTLPVYRPNLTVDKSDITNHARTIGTFEDSAIDTGCNRIAPSHPETNASLEAVRTAEPDDLFERAKSCAQDRTVVPIES